MDSYEKERLMTREELIHFGHQYLEGVGISSICNVCIAIGGSCCKYCNELEEGKGCKNRNTSCTAWLCGYLKLILYKAGLLDEWEEFWEKIPGQAYRMDYTPSIVSIQKEIDIPSIQSLSEAFAKDLTRLNAKHKSSDNIIELNDKLDRYITRFSIYKDEEILEKAKNELNQLISCFYSFKFALQSSKYGE
ncbi:MULTISPECIES: hypothetical protein [unclassified Bacillus (in: firmicutes)]|uniref:hypothetical protein n=1 Tax=unclassified Bacillus (in: firmicutes) TaxID=185979 RepID=UPI000BEF8A8F|nr:MULTISPECIES: hypothetical protein [unclassified Bacillus (in: firmicutes)]PEJ57644.1 hypothetical protein CN692_12200 [Bacillus sp. AFS002410]PEL08413.1 hypothetical protein CN601_16980 [Bacillus sp. AFS017336]